MSGSSVVFATGLSNYEVSGSCGFLSESSSAEGPLRQSTVAGSVEFHRRFLSKSSPPKENARVYNPRQLRSQTDSHLLVDSVKKVKTVVRQNSDCSLLRKNVADRGGDLEGEKSPSEELFVKLCCVLQERENSGELKRLQQNFLLYNSENELYWAKASRVQQEYKEQERRQCLLIDRVLRAIEKSVGDKCESFFVSDMNAVIFSNYLSLYINGQRAFSLYQLLEDFVDSKQVRGNLKEYSDLRYRTKKLLRVNFCGCHKRIADDIKFFFHSASLQKCIDLLAQNSVIGGAGQRAKAVISQAFQRMSQMEQDGLLKQLEKRDFLAKNSWEEFAKIFLLIYTQADNYISEYSKFEKGIPSFIETSRFLSPEMRQSVRQLYDEGLYAACIRSAMVGVTERINQLVTIIPKLLTQFFLKVFAAIASQGGSSLMLDEIQKSTLAILQSTPISWSDLQEKLESIVSLIPKEMNKSTA